MRTSIAFSMLLLLPACGSVSVGDPGGHGGAAATTSSSAATSSGATTSSGTSGGCRSDRDCDPTLSQPQSWCFSTDSCVGWAGCSANGNNPSHTTCKADADCTDAGAGVACRQCGGGRGVCTAACTTTMDCGAGATCNGQGACIPTPCTADAQCPANLGCSPGDGFCVRKSCTTDAQCQGFCVQGSCVETLGSCSYCT